MMKGFALWGMSFANPLWLLLLLAIPLAGFAVIPGCVKPPI